MEEIKRCVFLIFINDLPDDNKSNIKILADDNKLNSNVARAEKILQRNLIWLKKTKEEQGLAAADQWG